ncbi:MAG: hypothetical protein KC547_23305, partial [Anaerolineae bacterium]|nr:hypothetical protein [Anaerolineae bacterium]
MGAVKKWQRFTVVLGNPPYSVSSANNGRFISSLLDLYKERVRQERNIQPLSDDYIKFIRFGHFQIQESNVGIIGFITNRSYLFGLVHRGMRHVLVDDFNQALILDLHGDSRIGENIENVAPDENVFEIQQGVAISFFVKARDKVEIKTVNYSSRTGSRAEKYGFLSTRRIGTTEWNELQLIATSNYLVPKDFSLVSEYQGFVSLNDLFATRGTCFETRHDALLIAFTKVELEQRMALFSDLSVPNSEIEDIIGVASTRTWDLSVARRFVAESDKSPLYKCMYRPFDFRWVYYEPSIIERGSHSENTMRHMLEVSHNLGLLCSRQVARKGAFDGVFVTRVLAEKKSVDSTRSSSMFPQMVSTVGSLMDIAQGMANFTPLMLRWI